MIQELYWQLFQIALARRGADDFDAVKISLIVGDDDAAIGLNDGRDDCVERTLRASACFCFCFCHQLSPDERCLFFKREYATGKERLRPLIARKPSFESGSLLPFRFLQNASLYLGKCERRDE